MRRKTKDKIITLVLGSRGKSGQIFRHDPGGSIEVYNFGKLGIRMYTHDALHNQNLVSPISVRLIRLGKLFELVATTETSAAGKLVLLGWSRDAKLLPFAERLVQSVM